MTTILTSLSRPPVLAACGMVLLLTACSEATSPGQEASTATAPAATPAVDISSVPSGRYELDPNHGSLQFSVVHVRIANYVARFNKLSSSLVLDAGNLAASTITVEVDPTSVDTGYPGNYKVDRPDAGYDTWDEMLAQHTRYFQASQYPRITFQSTQVEQTAPDKLRVTGDLTMRGQTHPVTLDVTVVGAVTSHMISKRAALGFSATGTFNRSAYGITHLLQPGIVGDAITVRFEGEFIQAAEPGQAAEAGPEGRG